MASGSWLYADSAHMPVFIVRLPYDFWYEIARRDGRLDEGEEPDLDDEGFGYYVSFHGFRPDGTIWPDSGAHHSLEDAKAAAQSTIGSVITWSASVQADPAGAAARDGTPPLGPSGGVLS